MTKDDDKQDDIAAMLNRIDEIKNMVPERDSANQPRRKPELRVIEGGSGAKPDSEE